MAKDTLPPAGAWQGPFRNPWPWMWTGLGATAAATLVYFATGWGAWPLLVVGLLATGVAVAIRPHSSVILGLAFVTGLCAWYASPPEWFSVRLLFAVVTAFTGVVAVLVLLPTLFRRAAISLLILFHFVGILTAVTTVQPTPWLSIFIWTHVYRPYLEFLYLNNAYHFYAPEPGPGIQAWFYVKYADKSGMWYKIPDPTENAVKLEYQRRLSICESINQVLPPGPISPEVAYRRRQAGLADNIPPHPDLQDIFQYRPPNFFSRRMLETYSRRICRTMPHPEDPSIPVVGVKIYRIQHAVLTPAQLAEGMDPTDPTLNFAFYQGEYDPEGRLKNPQDPYLFWLIPILRKQPTFRAGVPTATIAGADRKGEIVDYVAEHAKLDTGLPELAPDSGPENQP